MATETVVTLICDRCGHRQNKNDYCRGNSWGQLTLTWNGDQGGRSSQGDSAGITIKGDAYLCERCTESFLEWKMKP